MSSQHIFGMNAIRRLNKNTEYELWFLEDVYEILEHQLFPSYPDEMIYPLGKIKAERLVYGNLNKGICDWRPGFLKAGAPLVFGTIFKLLDMIIEWILEENGESQVYRFDQKIKLLKKPCVLPPAIESEFWLIERLYGLYSTLAPLRGTVIHNKYFSTKDGILRVASSKKGVVGEFITISADHLRKLALTVVSVLKYIDGSWHLDLFRKKTLRHNLDEISVLHGLYSLDQAPPKHTFVRAYLSDSCQLGVDVKSIQKDLKEWFVDQDCTFDLRVLIVRNGEVVDAYFFPWSVLSSGENHLHNLIGDPEYKIEIPEDINPVHLLENSC